MTFLFRLFIVSLVVLFLGFVESALGAEDIALVTAGQTHAPEEPFYEGAN